MRKTELTEKTIEDLDELIYSDYTEYEILYQIIINICEYLPKNIEEKVWDMI